MKPNPVVQSWRAHLTVAILVGLVLGAIVGVLEGISVLLSQDLVGRYNELVAWSIAFDTFAILALEIGLSVLNAITLGVLRIESVSHDLVALQLAESVFAAITLFGLWTLGTADPRLLAASPLRVIGPPALVGILLGEFVLVVVQVLLDRLTLLRRLSARYWLIAEGVVIICAVAFSFSH